MENLGIVIRFHEIRLKKIQRVIEVLSDLIKTNEVTEKVRHELEMQKGERDICESTISYLKQVK